MYWQTRELLLNTFESLLDQGGIVDEREKLVRHNFQSLQQAEQDRFDTNLKAFLIVFAPETAWMFDLSSIFEDIVELGIRFAEVKPYYGVTYFSMLGQGEFGKTSQQIQQLLYWLRRLLTKDERLALSLLRGYHYVVSRLSADELDRYIQEGLSCYEINVQLAQQFLEGILKDREPIIQNLTRECHLTDLTTQLEKLLFALTGQKVAVASLKNLYSYALIERNTRMVCLYRWLYLPERINYFVSKEMNKNWYLLQSVVAAGMFVAKSFPCIHGHPKYRTAANLVGDSILNQNLFQIVEYTRVLKAIQRRWPGSKTLVDFGIRTEYERHKPLISSSEQLFFDVFGMGDTPLPPSRGEFASVQNILNIAEHSQNLFETADLIHQINSELLLREYPDVGSTPLRTFGFLPDFFYAGGVRSLASRESREARPSRWRNFAFLPDFLHPEVVRTSPPEKTIFDLQHSHEQRQSTHQQQQTVYDVFPSHHKMFFARSKADENQVEPACYVYDEWSQEKNAYYPNYCYVYEKKAPFRREYPIPLDVIAESNKVRRIFELLKPDDARKEKRLPEGDEINEQRLIDYIIASKQEPCPKVLFFEKPKIKKRDIVVLLLLDISGSTGEIVNDRKAIEIEKQAALIFGRGLAAAGDRFAICGFSSNGHERCDFVIFKDFNDAWDTKSRSRVLAAAPMSTTRMGAALRHAGYRLWKIDARQKLILLISDGKPLDKDYSPETRYAQHDVRMACLENKRFGIVTFCLSTLENPRSDLELMFPNSRFVILNNIQQLTQLLPKFYMKLTL